jgi:hypothetical protein
LSGSSIETAVVEALASGDRQGAVVALLRGYGAELFGFLVTVLEYPAAVTAFWSTRDMIALELDDGLLSGSLSIWIYGLARRAALGQAGPVLGVKAKTTTLPDPAPARRRYSVRLRRAAVRLRRELTIAERLLLVLRIGRGFSWPEIAQVELGPRSPVAARGVRAKALASEFEALRIALRRDATDRGVFGRR